MGLNARQRLGVGVIGAVLLMAGALGMRYWAGAGAGGDVSEGHGASDRVVGLSPVSPGGEERLPTVSPDDRSRADDRVVASPSAGTALAPVVAEVSATELFRQYRDSGHGADTRFRGQRLGLSGTVASTEQNADGQWLVTLSAGDGLESVRALTAPTEQARASRLQAGAGVALNCLHHGTVMGEAVLADCRVVP